MRLRDRGWSRALDIQMDYHKWCSSEHGRLYNALFFQDSLRHASAQDKLATDEAAHDAAATVLQDHLVQTLWQADTMYVTSDMLHILLQAAHDLPDDVCFDEHTLITPCGFCVFEEPIVGTDGAGGETAIHGIAWKIILAGSHVLLKAEETDNVEKMLMIYFLVDPDDTHDSYNHRFNARMRAMQLPSAPLTLQHFFPTQFDRELRRKEFVSSLIGDTLAVFLAMQLLAQQTVGEPIQMRPDRAQRKRVAKWDGQDRVITLITLRRKSVKKDDHEPEKIEWSRRWLVRGHWRKQYYPKSKTHDWVYIFGYVKGPDDKPLVITERRVFDFRR